MSFKSIPIYFRSQTDGKQHPLVSGSRGQPSLHIQHGMKKLTFSLSQRIQLQGRDWELRQSHHMLGYTYKHLSFHPKVYESTSSLNFLSIHERTNLAPAITTLKLPPRKYSPLIRDAL